MMLISRSQEKLDDVAKSLSKCVYISVCVPQHHGNLSCIQRTLCQNAHVHKFIIDFFQPILSVATEVDLLTSLFKHRMYLQSFCECFSDINPIFHALLHPAKLCLRSSFSEMQMCCQQIS